MPTDEEIAAAEALIAEVHGTMRWSPWVMQDHGTEYLAAHDLLARAAPPDPDAPKMSPEGIQAYVDQRMAELDARIEADFARQEREEAQRRREQAERAQHYDGRRALARLALLEQHGMLRSAIRHRDETLEYGPVPDDPRNPRRVWLDKAEGEIIEAERLIGLLEPVVGDPETVIDENGWLPAERREEFFTKFAGDRESEVIELRERRRDLTAELKAAKGRETRAELREQLKRAVKRLEYLEAIPPMTPVDMCSECAWPEDWHEIGTTLSLEMDGCLTQPCLSWPMYQEHLKIGLARAMKVIEKYNKPKPPPVPVAPRPERIAVFDAGTPVADVISRLAAIQADHPEAEMRSGKRGTFEIWVPGPNS
jgi:hypothetical protein